MAVEYRGSKPIEAVGTNTVGFLGTSSKGPVNKPVFVTNWTQFTNTFGEEATCVGRNHARGPAIEKRQSELGLQLHEALCQRRLR